MTIEIFECEQGSPEWWACRLGIPTASEFSTVMAKGKDGKKDGSTSRTRMKYMRRLVGERITGEAVESYTNADMERGKEMEAQARDFYAFMHDAAPQRVGFIRNGEMGCSPDSLLGADGGLEIKTAIPEIQIDRLERNDLPPEHKAQVQGSLWVAEREWWDFISYWPRLPLFVMRVYRDEAYIREIEREVSAFLDEFHALEFRIRQLDGSASVMGALKASLDAGGHPLPAVFP